MMTMKHCRVFGGLLSQHSRSALCCKRFFNFGSNSASFDEEEVRKKFKSLGEGNIEFTRLDGANDGVAVLNISNPERKNALTGYMMVRFAEIVDELETWKDGKALILHGDKGTFASGADLSVVKVIHTPEEGDQMCAFMHRTLTRLRRLPLVSVAAIQGSAIGGGAELTTACDFRLLSKSAEIRYVHTRMGISPGWGGGSRLVKLVGRQKALGILLQSKLMKLENSIACGLVDDELPDDQDLVSSCINFLTPYISSDPSVVRAIKGVVAAADDLLLDEALQVERSIFASLWGGEANKEALKQNIKHK